MTALAGACAALGLASACLEIDDRKPGVLGAGATAGKAGSSNGGSGNNSPAQGGDPGDASSGDGGGGDAGGGGMPAPITVCEQGETGCVGNGTGTCNASGQWDVTVCPPSTPHCSNNTCGVPPSCEDVPAGCGPIANETCCMSPLVTGGTFDRSNDQNYPATLSDFRLDRYEVTVGRFRRFVDAVVGGWRPAPGSGKHSHLSGGEGLRVGSAEHEQGWEPSWDALLPSLIVEWDPQLTCDAGFATWTPDPSNNEPLPINCVSWYHAYAFCTWDGGFLPSEAEWNYAAAGGSEQRPYPWGPTVPGTNADLAIYGCYYNANGICLDVMNIGTVGLIEAGYGSYGQADLAGNVWEWTLDSYAAEYEPASCDDCANLAAGSSVVTRGGSFPNPVTDLPSYNRGFGTDRGLQTYDLGLRCARAP